MKNKKTNLLQQGFTLVELLVVIGIIGILAAALIAVIDPIEQLDKAQDTNKKSVSIEFLSGLSRYYASKGAYPWAAVNAGGTACNGAAQPGSGTLLNNAAFIGNNACIDDTTTPTTGLVQTGDLKSTYPQSTLLGSIYFVVYNNNNAACFLPKSKSVVRSGETKYTLTAGVLADASGGGGTCQGLTNAIPNVACYWCAQ